MRRYEKEVTDRAEIDSIIRRSKVCRLGMSYDGQPYIVPLCFGYDGKVLYFHCAQAGQKLDILRKNHQVCVEFDIMKGLVEADHACAWGMEYQSVIGFGTACFVENREEKKKALKLLMEEYSSQDFSFPEAMLSQTTIVKVEIKTLTGKQSSSH